MSSSNNFINHQDPTAPLNLSSIDVREQYTKLTEEERILVATKLLGYSHKPPTINQLISDDYYLGSDKFFNHGTAVFDFWKDALNKIYPNEITTAKPYLVLSGAIGIGKSTVSKICLCMTYARLACMPNPYKLLGTAPKPLSAIVFHRDENVAYREFKKYFDTVLEYSPFFKNVPHKPNFKVLTSGPRGGGGLGTDLIFSILGEINFWPNQEVAMERTNSTLIRFKSRYDIDVTTKVGQFIVDSSAKGSSDSVQLFLENTDPRYTWNCAPPHWDVRKNIYERSKGKTFNVYIGSGAKPPRLLGEEGEYILEEGMDPDRIIKVPIQLKGEFSAALEKSLQDLAGISTTSSNSFFGGNIERMIKCSTIKNRMPEIIEVDFFNKSDRIIDKVNPMLNLIPVRNPIWVGLDLSAARDGDMTGISGVSFEEWSNIDGVRVPKIKCHFCFAIKNKDDQEISLFHIFQFIQDLNKRFNICVSADQAFSKQLLQDCERESIPTNGRISTDLLPCNPALYLKYLINNELISLPFNKRLQREASDLVYTKTGKVDHPIHATFSNLFDNPPGGNGQKGSKDVWDSLASACYSLKLSIDEGMELGYSSGITKQLSAIQGLTRDSREESQKAFQNMIEDIF